MSAAQPQADGRAHLPALAVGAVAARAALLERLASGLQALRGGRGRAGEEPDPESQERSRRIASSRARVYSPVAQEGYR